MCMWFHKTHFHSYMCNKKINIEFYSSMSLCMLSGSARWLQRICGQLLSQRLLHKNGVQNVLRGVFEATVTSESVLVTTEMHNFVSQY